MTTPRTLLDLGFQPLVNNLCATAQEALDAERYALRAVCGDDLTIRLDTEVPPEKLYAHYLYRSGVSQPYIDHCKELYKSLSHLNLQTVMDIGGNDGTLLNTFRTTAREHSFWSGTPPQRFINVDMSRNLRAINESASNEYVCGQFSDTMNLPRANLIVSTNVFQHTKNIHAFLRGIVKNLDGVWVLEFPYTLTTLQTLQFDQFYHEHYYYWLLSPLVKLFRQYGLRIIHAKQFPIHGGTMRLWMTNKVDAPSEITAVLESYIRQEEAIDFDNFNAKSQDHMARCIDFIEGLKGRTVFFGAAAKGGVFLDATRRSIANMPDAFVVDDTAEKQGLFMPGTGFEICSRERLAREKVDNIVILAHNFADYIASSLRPIFSGRLYTCLPSIVEL